MSLTMYTETIPPYFIRELLSGVEIKKKPVKLIMRKASIPLEFISQDQIRFSACQYANLTHAISSLLEDEFLGFLKSKAPPGSFEMMCHAASGCDDLKAFIERCIKFIGLFTNEIEWRLSTSGKETTFVVIWKNKSPEYLPVIQYLSLFFLHRLSGWFIGKQIILNEVNFAYTDPGYAKAYRFLFPCRHMFNSTCTSFTFDKKFLSNILIRSDSDVRKFVKHGITKLLVLSNKDEGITYRIRTALKKLSKKEIPSFETVAENLNMSTATLSRSLLKEKTTYQIIKDEFRRDIAINQFRDEETSIETVAEITGFSEASSFQRAFKRWTGINPGAYKKALKNAKAV